MDPNLEIRGERWGGCASRPLDKRWACLQKNFFGPFGPQFGLEIRLGGGGSQGPSLGSATPFRPLAGTGNGNFIYRRYFLQVHNFTFKYRKTNFLTNLKSKIKTKIIKIKRKHLLFKEAVCKNRISLIKLFVNRNLCLLIFP